MAFHPGQLVVCVDDEMWRSTPNATIVGDLDGLRRGAVYTVRDFAVSNKWFESIGFAGPWVRVEEIVRSGAGVPSLADLPFAAYRFRPLSDSRLDVFRKVTAPLDEVPA